MSKQLKKINKTSMEMAAKLNKKQAVARNEIS